jgi:hypothetical protein
MRYAGEQVVHHRAGPSISPVTVGHPALGHAGVSTDRPAPTRIPRTRNRGGHRFPVAVKIPFAADTAGFADYLDKLGAAATRKGGSAGGGLPTASRNTGSWRWTGSDHEKTPGLGTPEERQGRGLVLAL